MLATRHGAAHSEGAGLVGAGGDDPVGVRIAADDDGLAPPGRVVQLLDGGEEGVQIYQQDGRALPRRQVASLSFTGQEEQGMVPGPEWAPMTGST